MSIQYRLSLNDRFITMVLEARKIVIIDGQEKPLAHSDVKFGEMLEVKTKRASGRGQFTQ